MKNLLYILPIVLLQSCVKDKPFTPSQPAVQLSNAQKVYVINEGGYTHNNSSISLFDTENGNVIENFYKDQNNNAILGDVAQSMSYFNSQFYIVVNNSGKIVVCDNKFKQKTIIAGFPSPRHILPITNSKAYVSDYFSNSVQVLNLNSNTITNSIPCAGWTEQMVLIYNKAYITNMKRKYVYIINTTSDTKTDSIEVGPFAGSIVIDKNDNIWVLSSGDKQNNIPASLKKIDPITNQVNQSFTFSSTDSPNNLCFNKTKDTLYYLNNGICRMAITENTLPANAFIAKGSKNFYGLGINPTNYNIYAADALDYTQRSNVYIYDAAGNQKTFFKAGINSNSFYFE